LGMTCQWRVADMALELEVLSSNPSGHDLSK
jgi:hypothetical protein